MQTTLLIIFSIFTLRMMLLIGVHAHTTRLPMYHDMPRTRRRSAFFLRLVLVLLPFEVVAALALTQMV